MPFLRCVFHFCFDRLQQAEEEHKTVLEEKQTLEKNMKNEIAFAKVRKGIMMMILIVFER